MKTKMKKILSLFLSVLMVMTVLPSFVVSAYAEDEDLDALSTPNEGYTYSIEVETLRDAGGWTSAYFRISSSDDSTNIETWDILSDIDSTGGVFETEYTDDIFYDNLELYVDFGGAISWRSWSGMVTVKINDITVWEESVSASSSAFVSSDKTFTVSLDKPHPSSFDVYMSENESGERDRDLKFVQSKDDTTGVAVGYLYWEIIDNYNTYWKASEDSKVTVKAKNFTAFVDWELSTSYKLIVESDNAYDFMGTLTLKADGLKEKYYIDFLFYHNIDVEAVEHGDVTVSDANAKTGDTVTLSVQPQDGYALKSLTVTDDQDNEIDVTDYKFTMPNSEVKIAAEFEPITYTAKFVANGKVVAEIPYTVETTEITEPDVPAKGGYIGYWELYSLSIGGVVVEAKYDHEIHDFRVSSSTPATCTEEGYDTYTCTICGESYNVTTTPATGHNYKVTSSTPATCATEGYDTYTCEVCGATYNKTTTPAIGHNYKVTSSTPATCATEGYDTYTCEVCGATYNKTTTPAKAHQFVAVDYKEPTCTEVGYVTYKCLNCDETFNGDYCSSKGHRYVADVVAPTCSEEGYTYYICEDCGETRNNADGSLYRGNITKPVAHVFNTISTVAPTCGEDGKRISECVNCGYVQEEVIPATGDHKYTAILVTEPTCGETGVMAYMCANCDAIYYEEIPATGDHNYDGSICIEDADNDIVNPSHTCTECGHKEALTLNGWFKHPENGKWMFLENNAKRCGWLHIPTPFDQWYYLGTDGYMVTGLNEINEKNYYFNGYGVMQTGWKKVDDNWYYFSGSGAMQTGWKKVGSSWYYFENSGKMRTESLTYKGKVYNFSKSGVCQNP